MTYVNCLWHGGALGDLEQICLLSMLRQQCKVRLFCYERIANVPAGIEVADAREIMPSQDLLVHRATGSPSLGSNKFRYLIMKKGLGIWLDADVILVNPLPQAQDHIFGWQRKNCIGTAVLYLPQNSPVVDEICEFASQKYPIPPFYDDAARSELEQKSKSGSPIDVRDLPWGVYGPNALTYFVRKNGLLHFAKSKDVFYPVPLHLSYTLLSSRYDVSELITTSAVAVHLWNNDLRTLSKTHPGNPGGRLIIEKDCFVEKFAREQLGYRLSNTAYTGVSRNAECPCGSGKRFKHCHGIIRKFYRSNEPGEGKVIVAPPLEADDSHSIIWVAQSP